jgi:hypothetical protein
MLPVSSKRIRKVRFSIQKYLISSLAWLFYLFTFVLNNNGKKNQNHPHVFEFCG